LYYAKFLKEKYVFIVILIGTIIPYANLSFNFYLNEGQGKLTTQCLAITSQPKIEFKDLYLQWILNGTLHMGFIIIGIYFDLKMLAFLRKRNKTQPILMIPWKSVSQKDKQEEVDVPLKVALSQKVFQFGSSLQKNVSNHDSEN
jgi:hypothetical protein